jgi:hypothetical protein
MVIAPTDSAMSSDSAPCSPKPAFCPKIGSMV